MAQVRDPVCGMTIDSNDAAGQSQYQGKTFYFCSSACKQKFDADPKQYATSTTAPRSEPERRI